MMVGALMLAIPDDSAIDVSRGVATTIGVALAVSAVGYLAAMQRRSGLVPGYVRLAVVAWFLGDIYVAAREAQQIGQPMFLLGLPLALAWEVCALLYLRRMWQATSGLRRRAEW
jgi:hypothetical protein